MLNILSIKKNNKRPQDDLSLICMNSHIQPLHLGGNIWNVGCVAGSHSSIPSLCQMTDQLVCAR